MTTIETPLLIPNRSARAAGVTPGLGEQRDVGTGHRTSLPKNPPALHRRGNQQPPLPLPRHQRLGAPAPRGASFGSGRLGQRVGAARLPARSIAIHLVPGMGAGGGWHPPLRRVA